MTTFSPAETVAFARQFAARLKPGDVVALTGELGAGKTCFVKGLVGTGDVTSPTFTLIHEYRGRVPLYHIDLYRLNSVQEALAIGIEDYLPAADGITVIEWAEKIEALLPEHTIRVRIEIAGETTRRIEVA
jgi:tRNA threonylcarbamoyladenosine biosynthesis protein TsaE